jgi:hypothetical protein
MTIQIPKRYSYLIGQISEEEILLIAFMHYVKKQYPNHDYYSIWQYDITTILGVLRTGEGPAFMFKNLTRVFNVAMVSDYKFDMQFKHWEPEEVDYQLESFRSIVVWSYILDQGALAEYEHNIPSKTFWLVPNPGNRNFVGTIKAQYKDYKLDKKDEPD